MHSFPRAPVKHAADAGLLGISRRHICLLALPLLALASAPLAAQTTNTPRAKFTPEIVTEGLRNPWALAFIDDGYMLVTERPGALRVVDQAGNVSEPLSGLPELDAREQGGMLDIVADRNFAQNRTVYFCFSEPGEGGNSTAMASAQLNAERTALSDVRVIFSQRPKFDSAQHFGCRIAEAADGTLFLTLGDRFSRMEDAQRLDNHHGKVVRVNKDGSIPPDNPFVGNASALPEIWSYGHRNAQGATISPDGVFWMHEHGAQGGDEINVPQAGGNYGWPLVSFGLHYGGGPVGDGSPAKAGLHGPIHHWTPSIAPSGMAFLQSDRYGPQWRGNVFVGALAGQRLVRLNLDGNRVIAEENLMMDYARIRDVRVSPEGELYVLTDSANGQLIRLRPN